METALIEKVEKPVNEIVAKASAMTCRSNEERLAVGEYLKTIKGMQKEVSATFDPIVDKAHAVHKEAVAQRKKYYDPLVTAESALKNKAISYDVEQQRKAREEQDRLDRIAREEEECKRKALETKAEKALYNGKTEKAEELLEQAASVFVPAPTVQVNAVKVSGQALTETWSAEVTDLMALVKAVAQGIAPISFLDANISALNKQAKATKDTFKIPGVNFKKTVGMSSRAV